MIRPAVLLLALLTAASCGKSSPTQPTTPIPAGPSTVLVPNGTAGSGSGPGFNPTPLTVAVGTTVTWGNNDSTTHTTTSDAAGWNFSVNAGNTATVKFDTPGTFAYHCTIHSFMKGTVVVQ
jgi:plastocyanin